MPYGNRIIVDASTGQVTEVPVDDTWILANKADYVELSITPGGTYALTDTPTLSVQIKTPFLSDDSQNDILEIRTIELQIGEETVEITTDANGQWSDTLDFMTTGSFDIRTSEFSTHNSNILNIVVS